MNDVSVNARATLRSRSKSVSWAAEPVIVPNLYGEATAIQVCRAFEEGLQTGKKAASSGYKPVTAAAAAGR